MEEVNYKLTETDKEVSDLAGVDCCLEFAWAFKTFWYDCSTLFNASIAFQFFDLKSYRKIQETARK